MDLEELEAVAQAIGAGGPRRILRIPDEIDGGGIAGAIIFDAQLLTFIAEVAGVGAEDSRRISVNPPEGNGILRQDNDLVSGDVRSIGEAVSSKMPASLVAPRPSIFQPEISTCEPELFQSSRYSASSSPRGLYMISVIISRS